MIKPELRENLNLLITAAAFLLIPIGGGYLKSQMDTQTATITAHSDANVAALKQSITESYETQAAHKSDIESMAAWNKTLAAGQQSLADKVDKNNIEERLAIQSVSDKISNLKAN